jgi:hypothetical protein
MTICGRNMIRPSQSADAPFEIEADKPDPISIILNIYCLSRVLILHLILIKIPLSITTNNIAFGT